MKLSWTTFGFVRLQLWLGAGFNTDVLEFSFGGAIPRWGRTLYVHTDSNSAGN